MFVSLVQNMNVLCCDCVQKLCNIMISFRLILNYTLELQVRSTYCIHFIDVLIMLILFEKPLLFGLLSE